VWAIPLSMWLLGERLTRARVAGLAFGMAGLALLVGAGAANLGSLLVLGAALSWALGSVLQKRFPVSMATAPYTAWIMLLGGVPIFAGALLLEDWRALAGISAGAALGIAYNVLVAFAWAHWAWIKLARSVPVAIFSLSMLAIPLVGVVSGMLVLGERPAWSEYAGLALVLAALFSVLRPQPR